MLNVPSVTMNGGSAEPDDQPAVDEAERPRRSRCPSRIASTGGTPESTASLVITIEPSAITVPHDRSMPAVRMISVWPMASVPTTITCWMISEKFVGSRNRSRLRGEEDAGEQQRDQRAELGDALARDLRDRRAAAGASGGAAGRRRAGAVCACG